VCDLETSRLGAPYIYDISHLRIKDACKVNLDSHVYVHCMVPKQPGENGEAKGPVPNVDACLKYVSEIIGLFLVDLILLKSTHLGSI
jgi:hypothetical protein